MIWHAPAAPDSARCAVSMRQTLKAPPHARQALHRRVTTLASATASHENWGLQQRRS
jgi:hypothetical protein